MFFSFSQLTAGVLPKYWSVAVELSAKGPGCYS